jgi:hypothetical protein
MLNLYCEEQRTGQISESWQCVGVTAMIDARCWDSSSDPLAVFPIEPRNISRNMHGQLQHCKRVRLVATILGT